MKIVGDPMRSNQARSPRNPDNGPIFLHAYLLDESDFSTGSLDYSQLGACTQSQSLIISGSRKEAYGKKRSGKPKACTETKSTIL